MSHLGIIAAFPGELQPLVKDWVPATPHGSFEGYAAWRGRLGQVDCLAIAAGMGREAAARACRMAELLAAGEGGLNGLISFGWAGALSCGLSPGRPYRVAEVVDARTDERFAAQDALGLKPRLTLVTIDHVAQFHEKRSLAEKYQAVLVDMEAATVAAAARQRQIPFYCLKAVSDAQGDLLPDFSRHTDAQGKIRMFSLLAHLAVHPKYWRSVVRIGKNSKIGARGLAGELREYL